MQHWRWQRLPAGGPLSGAVMAGLGLSPQFSVLADIFVVISSALSVAGSAGGLSSTAASISRLMATAEMADRFRSEPLDAPPYASTPLQLHVGTSHVAAFNGGALISAAACGAIVLFLHVVELSQAGRRVVIGARFSVAPVVAFFAPAAVGCAFTAMVNAAEAVDIVLPLASLAILAAALLGGARSSVSDLNSKPALWKLHRFVAADALTTDENGQQHQQEQEEQRRQTRGICFYFLVDCGVAMVNGALSGVSVSPSASAWCAMLGAIVNAAHFAWVIVGQSWITPLMHKAAFIAISGSQLAASAAVLLRTESQKTMDGAVNEVGVTIGALLFISLLVIAVYGVVTAMVHIANFMAHRASPSVIDEPTENTGVALLEPVQVASLATPSSGSSHQEAAVVEATVPCHHLDEAMLPSPPRQGPVESPFPLVVDQYELLRHQRAMEELMEGRIEVWEHRLAGVAAAARLGLNLPDSEEDEVIGSFAPWSRTEAFARAAQRRDLRESRRKRKK